MTDNADIPAPDAQVEDRAPLLAHLIELRRRFIICLVALLVGTGLCYSFASEIYAFLVRPLAQALPEGEHKRMIYTGLAEAFFTYLRLAVFGGVFLAFPVVAAQFYGFIAPGLYKRERIMLLPYLIAAPLLFIAGAALAYYFIFPLAWHFFLSFETSGGGGQLPIQLEAKVSEYLGLSMHLLLAFGFSFQLPVVLTLLAQFGMVKSETLSKGRRYALVAIVAVAAVITPPDVFSQIALSIPLYLLYEVSLLACRYVERKKQCTTSD